MRSAVRACTAVIALATAGACTTDERLPPTAAGELINGAFLYACVDATDPRCDVDPMQFPKLVAVGGLIGVEFAYHDMSISTSPALEPVSSGLSAMGSAQFVVEQAGYTGILAVVDGDVVGVFHVNAETPTGVAVLAETEEDVFKGVDTLRVLPDATVELKSQTQSPEGEALAGAMEYTWTIADEAVATLAAGAATSFVTLQAGSAEAETTLTVAANGLETTVDVIVTLDPGTDTGGTTSGGSGSGTNTETGGGTDTSGSGTSSGSGTTTATGSGTTSGTGSGSGSATTSATTTP